jgi:hypothetical protein
MKGNLADQRKNEHPGSERVLVEDDAKKQRQDEGGRRSLLNNAIE